MRPTSRIVSWAVTATCVLSLCGCSFLDSFVPKKGDNTDVMDRQQNLSLDDFRNLNKIDKEPDADGDPKVTAQLGAPPIPDVAQVLAAPRPPKVANTKLVTLAVTDDVPLRDVLLELGRLANVDIEVGPGLDTTGINLRATDRPFNEVIERIATLGHLRYKTTGSSIRVEKDLPYIKNYSLDFLNLVRSSTSTYQISTSILGNSSSSGSNSGGSSNNATSSASGGGSGVTPTSVGTTGTQSNISGNSDSDMWSGLEASLNEIIAYDPNPSTTNTPGSNGTSSTLAGAKSGTGAVGTGLNGGSIVINRQAGVLSANATEAQHEMIAHFLAMMTRNSAAQVLIEAKIVEVQLTDQFAAGVDWNKILNKTIGSYQQIGSYAPDTLTDAISANGPTVGAGTGSVAFGIDGSNLNVVLRAAQEFGTTRTLSSPRLSATNNQQAVLTFARNEVFFNCTTTPGSTVVSNGSSIPQAASTNCTPNAVPIGIILNILPAINLDKQEVVLNVRPTLTRVVATTPDPTPGVTNTYPVVEVRELDSVMRVTSGGIMVIGGLMEDITRNTSGMVPGVGEVPIFGDLFKSRSEDSSKRELIIFIKATIVNPDGSSDRIDRKVYNKYVTDPRPLFGPQQ